MKTLAIWTIMKLGRYAVLPIAAAILGAAGYAANWAMMNPGYISLSLAGLLLLVSMPSVALAIGVLFAGLHGKPGQTLSREAAPGLWQLWDRFDRSGISRTLAVDDDLNASISERKLVAGVFGRRLTMTVGLPLLILFDKEAVEAIVAHEVAHATLMHTSGTIKLAEFNNAFDALFAYADPDETVTGALAHFALAGLWRSLDAELKRRSRQCEIEADTKAAGWTSRAAMAKALVLVATQHAITTEEVYRRYEAELLGAVSIPKSPILRIYEGRDGLLSEPDISRYAADAYQVGADPDSSHPSLKERLANLDITSVPELTVGESAARTILVDKEFKRLWLTLIVVGGDWRKPAWRG